MSVQTTSTDSSNDPSIGKDAAKWYYWKNFPRRFLLAVGGAIAHKGYGEGNIVPEYAPVKSEIQTRNNIDRQPHSVGSCVELGEIDDKCILRC